MLQIKRLTPGYSTTVTSAKGIEYAKNLEQLHITVNSKWENGKETPANLTSIASLGKLKGLILNGIAQNVDFLANMTNLEQLTITITNTNSDNINLIKNICINFINNFDDKNHKNLLEEYVFYSILA